MRWDTDRGTLLEWIVGIPFTALIVLAIGSPFILLTAAVFKWAILYLF